MKKGFLILLCCVLFCFGACTSVHVFEETVPTTLAAATGFAFSEDTVVCGVNIGGMSPEAAHNAILKRVADFKLNLTVNEVEFIVTKDEIGFFFDEEGFLDFCEAAEAGDSAQPEELIQYDGIALQSILETVLESKAVDAQVVFSQEKGVFICLPSLTGTDVDLEAVMAAVEQAAAELRNDVNVAAETTAIPPALTECDAELKKARNTANMYLRVLPEYVFSLDRGETAVEMLTRETAASFISIGKDFSVSLDEAAILTYATQMGDKYSTEARTGDFLTTGGGTVSLPVEYNGRIVDETALAEDILLCMTEHIGGSREAPYAVYTDVVELPFGGNYVEIDLTAQTLWVYKDGLCVVESPVVSGCVAEGSFTPNGVYKVYEKDADCWLTGPTWSDYVEYWIAFYQDFGIHDASWRSEFGGDIYLYEGSHGCPNLPPELADDVYHNVDLGTKVILYGGETAVQQLTQEITGTTEYDLKVDDQPFALDVNLKYPGAQLRYRSSNPQVAVVASDGTVTVKGPGSAVITVVAAGFTFHSGASMPVQIQVAP